MTSIADRPHLRRVEDNPRVGIGVDVEDPECPDGQRPNRQVRATGVAELLADDAAIWTTRITEKYLRDRPRWSGPRPEATMRGS